MPRPHGGCAYSFFFGKKRVEKEMPFLFCLRFLSAKKKVRAGVYYGEVPPVPIPNTEVKLTSAEDTWREAAWKNRSSPAQRIAVPAGAAIHSYSSLAQSVEHAAVNRRVVGSSPTGGATNPVQHCWAGFFHGSIGTRLFMPPQPKVYR